MIEQVMYLGIGFLAAGLVGLLFVPLIHNRAVRLTTKRVEAAIPLSLKEISADKDQIRARCAISLRELEVTVERLKTKLAAHMAEITKKTDIINELKKEFCKKDERVVALEANEKTLRTQLRAAVETFEVQSNAVEDAKLVQSTSEGKLQKLRAELDQKRRLLNERDREIERLEQELFAARELNGNLNHKVLVVNSRGREVADKLNAEVERLQSELSTSVATRANLKQKIVAIQRETKRSWSAERFEKFRW